MLLGRYADRCYASFDHAKQRERDTGALVMCCVSLFSAYPVFSRSDIDKLQGKGNYDAYRASCASGRRQPSRAHLLPLRGCVAVPSLSRCNHPCNRPFTRQQTCRPSPSLSGSTYMELVLFESAQVTLSLTSTSRRLTLVCWRIGVLARWRV